MYEESLSQFKKDFCLSEGHLGFRVYHFCWSVCIISVWSWALQADGSLRVLRHLYINEMLRKGQTSITSLQGRIIPCCFSESFTSRSSCWAGAWKQTRDSFSNHTLVLVECNERLVCVSLWQAGLCGHGGKPSGVLLLLWGKLLQWALHTPARRHWWTRWAQLYLLVNLIILDWHEKNCSFVLPKL